AGCVLADRLSACGKYQVCLLEAGPKDKNWSIHLPLGVINLMRSRTLNWQLYSAEEANQKNRKIFNPRGKTLGGSSSVNAMLYVRGQKEDYDHWAALGNDGWSYDEVLPYFKSTQHQERGEDEFHGINGPLNVADTRAKPAVHDDFILSAQQAGFPANDDFNGATQEGVGYYQVTQKNGQRCSSAKAFLTPNLHRANLTVVTDAQVQKILVETNNDGSETKVATGVCYKIKNKEFSIYADKEVLLSAGTFNSPQLLMLSGIGPKDELNAHGIPIIHELAGVGENLQDHPDTIVVNRHKNENLLALRPKAIWWLVKESFKYFQKKRMGILTSAVAESGGFIKSRADLSRPDLQLHFIPAAFDDHGRDLKIMFNYGIALHTCLLRPKSRGNVSLYGNKAELPPKIKLNMLDHKDDQRNMIQALKIARSILNQSPLKDNNGSEILPGNHTQSDAEILTFLKNKSNTIYHPVGTCKMGNDELAVVDNELKVHGINHLRVVDASIMPTLISGNTNAPTIMVAAKIADNILAAHQ
ncbi:MAG: GMC family oxidoreductase N-terminal domain-containing protein, partial [Gammaproteobacteria bacterium]|nr:GMC family oxidoreductase N-terminal domain-containing protein [Gammaproteobacteria bacterium]